MTETTTTTICPSCGSGKIGNNLGETDDGHRFCDDCGWKGGKSQLITVPLPKDSMSLDASNDRALLIARHMSEQYLKLIYEKASPAIGRCILQAGLVGKKDTKGLTRMLRAACMGAHKATLEEAEQLAAAAALQSIRGDAKK